MSNSSGRKFIKQMVENLWSQHKTPKRPDPIHHQPPSPGWRGFFLTLTVWELADWNWEWKTQQWNIQQENKQDKLPTMKNHGKRQFCFFPSIFFKHNTCKTHFRSRRAKSQEPAVAPGVRLCRCMFHTQPHVCAFDFLCTVCRLLYVFTNLCIWYIVYATYAFYNRVWKSQPCKCKSCIFCILCILVLVTLSSKMHASAPWLLRQSYFLAQVMASINGQACWRLWNHASSDPHACRMLYSNNNTLCETRGEWGTDAYSTHHRIPPPPAEKGASW